MVKFNLSCSTGKAPDPRKEVDVELLTDSSQGSLELYLNGNLIFRLGPEGETYLWPQDIKREIGRCRLMGGLSKPGNITRYDGEVS